MSAFAPLVGVNRTFLTESETDAADPQPVIRSIPLELPIGLSHRPRNSVVSWPLHEMTPTRGSHGKLHRTTKILSHARRRGGLAARGAGAAAADAGDRVTRPHIV